jgi:hypothetical protein
MGFAISDGGGITLVCWVCTYILFSNDDICGVTIDNFDFLLLLDNFESEILGETLDLFD